MVTWSVDARAGSLADRLEASEPELLRRYRERLAATGSSLLLDEEVADQLGQQASSVLARLVHRLRSPGDPRTDGALDLSSRIGSRRAARRTHPSESIRAARTLVEVTTEIVLECGRAQGTPSELVIEVLGVLGDTVLQRLQDAATSYAGFLLEEVQATNDHERRRISRELHDRAGHGVSAAMRQVELAQIKLETAPDTVGAHLERALDSVTDALETLCQIAAGLRLEGLDVSMAAALQRFAATAPGLDIEVDVNGSEHWLPGPVRDEVFLILREAVQNAHTHSGASRVTASVDIAPHELRAAVADDGHGFDVTHPGGGSGLRSIRERAELVGGSVRIHSCAGGGTSIELYVPVVGAHRDTAV